MGFQKVTISFTMTNDGKIIQGDETYDDIIFNFTGDDGVWAFVDNVLVLDLGGIHDCAGGSINFAENTINFYGAANDCQAGDMRPVAEGGYNSAYSNTALLSQGPSSTMA